MTPTARRPCPSCARSCPRSGTPRRWASRARPWQARCCATCWRWPTPLSCCAAGCSAPRRRRRAAATSWSRCAGSTRAWSAPTPPCVLRRCRRYLYFRFSLIASLLRRNTPARLFRAPLSCLPSLRRAAARRGYCGRRGRGARAGRGRGCGGARRRRGGGASVCRRHAARGATRARRRGRRVASARG
jgi:hypothetical protein